jgi:hypothetical protein
MIKWLLHFKGSEDDSGNPTTFKAAFYEDFSLISTGHGKMNWQVAISLYAYMFVDLLLERYTKKFWII